jgi:mannosyltransferase
MVIRLTRERRHEFLSQIFLSFQGCRATLRLGRIVFRRKVKLLRLSWLEVLLFSALLVCVALRFVALTRQSLWADELFAVFWAKSGAVYILSHAADETNPPLYSFLLALWIWVFGASEGAVRLLSACISVITVLVIYVLGNSLFDRRAAIIAALLLALSSWNLYFAQEARVFAIFNLDFAVTILSINGVIVRLQGGASATSVFRSLPAAGFLLSGVAAPYLHYVAFPMFVTIAVALVLIWWRDVSFNRRYFVCFTVLGALVALLSTPALALAVRQRHSPSLAWMSFPSATKFLGLVAGAPDWKGAPDWVLGAVVIISAGSAIIWATAFIYGSWKYRGRSAFVLVYLLPIIGFCVLATTSLFQPFLFTRTVVWISVPVYLGLGGAVTALWDFKARSIAAAAIILSQAIFTPGYFAFSFKEPWRAGVHSYAAGMTSGDLLILGDDTPAIAFVYYHEERLVPQLRRWRSSMTAADKLDEHVTGIRSITDNEIAAAAQRGAKLIFVSRGCDTPSGVERANADMDLFSHCDGPPLSGWTLVLQFMRHIWPRV